MSRIDQLRKNYQRICGLPWDRNVAGRSASGWRFMTRKTNASSGFVLGSSRKPPNKPATIGTPSISRMPSPIGCAVRPIRITPKATSSPQLVSERPRCAAFKKTVAAQLTTRSRPFSPPKTRWSPSMAWLRCLVSSAFPKSCPCAKTPSRAGSWSSFQGSTNKTTTACSTHAMAGTTTQSRSLPAKEKFADEEP